MANMRQPAAAPAAANKHGSTAATDATSRSEAPARRLIKDPVRYKTQMCANWVRAGECPYGFKCQFAHGQEELRDRPAKQTTNGKSRNSRSKSNPVSPVVAPAEQPGPAPLAEALPVSAKMAQLNLEASPASAAPAAAVPATAAEKSAAATISQLLWYPEGVPEAAALAPQPAPAAVQPPVPLSARALSPVGTPALAAPAEARAGPPTAAAILSGAAGGVGQPMIDVAAAEANKNIGSAPVSPDGEDGPQLVCNAITGNVEVALPPGVGHQVSHNTATIRRQISVLFEEESLTSPPPNPTSEAVWGKSAMVGAY